MGLTVNGSYMIIREINKCHVKYYLNLGCDKRERVSSLKERVGVTGYLV